MEHTKGEWKNNGLEIEVFGRGVIAQCPTTNIGGVIECVANAQFIVRACNAHDDLLAACKEALELVYSSNKIDWDNILTPKLEAAIAKAEKGTG